MNINPMKLMGLKEKFNASRNSHPKFVQFVDVVSRKIEKGTVVGIKVTLPDGKVIESNINVNEADIELLKALKGM
ncbi:MAG: hypothetical protein J6Y90_03365 [Lachnospiraceae bacterium]|nr:hypothetical protein [Lachnospiraceae bacterium]